MRRTKDVEARRTAAAYPEPFGHQSRVTGLARAGLAGGQPVRA
jgi:hypothetical protein